MNKKNRGAFLILLATMTVMLLGFTALAIDVGHAFVVRNELQNAADAAALRGANYLNQTTGGINWTLATTEATNAIAMNKVDKQTLTDGTVTTGYWDLNSSTLQPTTIVPTNTDVPAIQVTLLKEPGHNGGPIELYFGPLVGVDTLNAGAKATAIMGAPISVGATQLFPLAMTESLYAEYWDTANNAPKNDPTTGEPYIFQVAPGPDGEWTTFKDSNTSASNIIALITTGNPTPLVVGDLIWISSGVKNSIYMHVPVDYDTAIPIVDSLATSQQTIVAFGGIHIVSVTSGADRSVNVQLSNKETALVGVPGGSSFGVYTSPRLVN